MQKAILLVLSALVFLALANDPEKEKKLPALEPKHKRNMEVPFAKAPQKNTSPSIPIEKKTHQASRSQVIPPISEKHEFAVKIPYAEAPKTENSPSILIAKDNIQASRFQFIPLVPEKHEWNVKIPYAEAPKNDNSPSIPVAKDTIQASRSQVIPRVSKKLKWDVKIPYAKTPKKETSPSTSQLLRVPPVLGTCKRNFSIPRSSGHLGLSIQVLVLNVPEKEDERLILERIMGRNLDWSFYNWDNGQKNEVKAHKSIILKYSPYCSKICQEFAACGDHRINSIPFNYPSRIVETLMTLLYEHSVNANESDYDLIMSCASELQFDNLIGILQD